MSSSAATSDTAGADCGAAFCASVDDALKNGRPDAVSDENLQHVLSAAVRLYAAKSEDRARELAPFGDRARECDRGGDGDLRVHARSRSQLLRSANVVPARGARVSGRRTSR